MCVQPTNHERGVLDTGTRLKNSYPKLGYTKCYVGAILFGRRGGGGPTEITIAFKPNYVFPFSIDRIRENSIKIL